MHFVITLATILNKKGGGCRRNTMLGKIRIVFVLFVPFVAVAQINTSIIKSVHTKVKILSVTDNVVSEDNYTKPDTGNKFISVKVLFDYSSCTSRVYPSFFDLKLRDLDGNYFKPSIKSFVVKKPYLYTTIIEADKISRGWVTFEIPKKLAINWLQIKYEKSKHLCSDWIPLWPVISNAERTKKIAKQVSREKRNSLFQAKQLILKKTLLSISNYLNYTTTHQPICFIKGLENAYHAKLLINSLQDTRLNYSDKKLPDLSTIITLLSQNLPENIVKLQSAEDKRSFYVNLRKLKKSVVKNYIQN